jgi:8-oxo-dGTP pyrophosphatase MutT (NUDIX family)
LTNPILRLPIKLNLGLARFRRGMTLGVRAAVLDGEGRVFLVRHSYTPGWYLPGGGVEPGEAIAAALDRELMEEGGIVLDRPAELFGLYLNRHISRRDHVALFVARDWRQPKRPRLPNLEIVDCGLFALDDLPDGTTAATRRRLVEIRKGNAISPEW